MRSAVLLLLFWLSLAITSVAQETTTKLKVGIYDHPPFAMRDADGRWKGLAVDLWDQISLDTQLPFEYVEVPLDQMILKLSRGEIDLVVGEMGVSAERERLVNFTQPFLGNPGAVALVRSSTYPKLKEILGELANHGLVTVLAFMLVTLIIFSLILWLIERRVQQGHFGGKPIHGFGSAIWFSAVTMTTVGYGDKTPQTLFGRFLAFLWMFSGILLVSAFTGTVASSLTVSRLNQSVHRLGDLSSFRNGVVQGSLAQTALTSAGIPAIPFATIEMGLKALADKKVTAFVSDEVSLRYQVSRDYAGLIVINSFPTARIPYAMAARPGLPEFEAVNVALIDVVEGPDWAQMLERWLGPETSK